MIIILTSQNIYRKIGALLDRVSPRSNLGIQLQDNDSGTASQNAVAITAERKAVLVVDQDHSILHLCGYVILQAGMRAYTTWDPGGAFTVLSQSNVDLVVTNLEFTTLSGIDLTHHIRTNYPNTHVIVMIPFQDADAAVKAIRGGASDYLTKPFSAGEFRAKLNEWSASRGPYSKWARRHEGGIPERRTLAGPWPVELLGSETNPCHVEDLKLANVGPRCRHAAIVADAVSSLEQIIERDVEETALFFFIDEQELRTAYAASHPHSGYVSGDPTSNYSRGTE
jgi:CheY-like chemotaxis protein